ncbi:MAG TPA: nucleotide exchange factor GrpE [Acidimicrobiales bacterium]
MTDPTEKPADVEPESHVDGELEAGEEQVTEGHEIEPVVSVEALLDDLDRVTAERDAYLDDSRRLAAEFANFRRQVEKRNADVIEHANRDLVEKLLPTLDACEAAVAHGATDVEPIFQSLLLTLEKEGLARVRPEGEPFDPTHHEAVMHEAGEGSSEEGPVVVEVLRTGYLWKGRVVRPAMVKVRG